MKGNVKKILLFSSMLLLVTAGCSGTNGANGTNGVNSADTPFLTVTGNSEQQAVLTWTQPQGATGYTVYSSTVSWAPFSVLGTTTSPGYHVNDLTPGKTYYFMVTAQLSSGESPYSNVVSYRSYSLYVYPENNSPIGIAIDQDGNILVTNHGNGTVSELSPSGTPGIYQTNTTYSVGSGPEAIAIDKDGNVLVTNYYDYTVSELSPSGTPGIYQTNTTYSVGTEPYAIAIDKDGNVLVVNLFDNTVGELSPTGTPGIYQTNTTYDVGFRPYAIAIDKDGNVFVANNNDDTVSELSPSGTPGIYQTNTTYSVGSEPDGIAVDKSGNVFVVNYGGSVTELSPTGTGGYYTYTTYTAGIGYEPEGGIAIDNSGNIWITNYCADSNCYNASVTELSPLDTTAYFVNASYTLLMHGYGIAIDASGALLLTNNSSALTELYGVATGPQFWPYAGPVFPGSGMW